MANKILEKILTQHEFIDILKIDIEGYENKILNHLKAEVLSRIRCIYAETSNNPEISGFSYERYSGLARYYRI